MARLGRRFWLVLVAAIVGTGALTAATTHRMAGDSTTPALVIIHLHEVDTSVVQTDNPPTGTSAGDLIVFTAAVSSGGRPFGRDLGNCAYVTTTEILCSIYMTVFGQGRIELQGALST